MPIRLVSKNWGRELTEALQTSTCGLRIIAPFIKLNALDRILPPEPRNTMVITRFDLDDFAMGVSDISALRKLLDSGSRVRGIRNLHAKLYVFGTSRAVITSANLTHSAFYINHEFGLVTSDRSIINVCRKYFDDLWKRAQTDLVVDQVDEWDRKVTAYRVSGGHSANRTSLGDFGTDIGIKSPPSPLPAAVADAPQAFVKFLGESNDRKPLSCPTIEEIERSGCHWAVAYPSKRRPRQVKDNDLIFIARLTSEPDIRIFGRAIGMEYKQGRDDASTNDISLHPWKKNWPRYIRVHNPSFVAGTMENGVSLNEMMETLRTDAFASTQHNAARGEGNTNPRRAYQQHAAVKLSKDGQAWLNDRLQAAFDKHGTVPQDTLDRLDRPELNDPSLKGGG